MKQINHYVNPKIYKPYDKEEKRYRVVMDNMDFFDNNYDDFFRFFETRCVVGCCGADAFDFFDHIFLMESLQKRIKRAEDREAERIKIEKQLLFYKNEIQAFLEMLIATNCDSIVCFNVYISKTQAQNILGQLLRHIDTISKNLMNFSYIKKYKYEKRKGSAKK